MNNIQYIKDEDFRKLTKKEKLEMSPSDTFNEIEIQRLLLIPTSQKSSGYCLGHFFAYTESKGWWKPTIYDCWQIVTDIQNPANLRYQILKGDFEYGGVNMFSIFDEHHKVYLSYGGQIIIKKK